MSSRMSRVDVQSKSRFWMVAMIIGWMCVLSGPAFAQDLLNEAIKKAAEEVATDLKADTAKDEDLAKLKRIAVSPLENDTDGKVFKHVRSALTTTDFDIILRDDDEWKLLLTEFKRQAQLNLAPGGGKGIALEISKDTVRQLRDQGVDAVVFGEVEVLEAKDYATSNENVNEATVRFFLHLADLEANFPWSRQFEKTLKVSEPISWRVRIFGIVSGNISYIGIGVAVIVGLVVLRSIIRSASTPR